MKVGIVGLKGSGKTTVFNALTGLRADTGFGAKEQANLGMIKVPDPRVDFLSSIYKPKKTTLAEIGFVDVAGPDEADTKGFGQKLLAPMREAEALVHVVRSFANPALKESVDMLRDLKAFDDELVLTDLMQVDAKRDRLQKEAKKNQESALIDHLHAHLDTGAPLRQLALSEAELSLLSGFRFLSIKPCIVLVNRADNEARAALPDAIQSEAKGRGLTVMQMAARAEAEIAELEPADQKAFLADLGLTEPARDRFVNTVYAQLELISFLTSGEDECRAWTIRKGTLARKAAGKIHSDIERGFIRAEVIAFQDFEEHPSEGKCREVGKLRLEGKDYVVKDGDIIHFRFNV
jgi:ribosome-binding ATPase